MKAITFSDPRNRRTYESALLIAANGFTSRLSKATNPGQPGGPMNDSNDYWLKERGTSQQLTAHQYDTLLGLCTPIECLTDDQIDYLLA